MVNSMLTQEFIFSRIAAGDAYFIGKKLTVPADGSTNIHVRNPHPDKEMWFVAMDIIAVGNHNIWMHDQFDSITDGSEIVIQNALLDSGGGPPDSGPFKAYSDSSFTASTDSTVPISIIRDTQPASHNIEFYPTAVEPGRELVIEIKNTESTSRDAIITTMICTSY